MTRFQYISLSIIVAILLGHWLSPDVVVLDAGALVLVFLVSIPLIAPFLTKAKLPGAEFEFRSEIGKTALLVEEAEKAIKEPLGEINEQGNEAETDLLEQNEQDNEAETDLIEEDKPFDYFRTFSISSAEAVIDTDPNLALAAVRLELERIIDAYIKTIYPSEKNLRSIAKKIKHLEKVNLLFPEQSKALVAIVKICNRGIHGEEVTRDEAIEVIELVDRFNDSVALGYSVRLQPNKTFEQQGLLCEWEHCVEHFPFSEDLSCPVFGHNCPGGKETLVNCETAKYWQKEH